MQKRQRQDKHVYLERFLYFFKVAERGRRWLKLAEKTKRKWPRGPTIFFVIYRLIYNILLTWWPTGHTKSSAELPGQAEVRRAATSGVSSHF
jgi:hypothetical protein